MSARRVEVSGSARRARGSRRQSCGPTRRHRIREHRLEQLRRARRRLGRRSRTSSSTSSASTAASRRAMNSKPSARAASRSTSQRSQQNGSVSPISSSSAATSAALSWIGDSPPPSAAARRAVDRERLLRGPGRRRRSRRSARCPSRGTRGWRARSSASACGSASACRDRSSSRRDVEAGHPHRADEDEPERVVGILELARRGPPSPSACGAAAMSSPLLRCRRSRSAPGDTTTAMSVVFHEGDLALRASRRSSSGSASSSSASSSAQLRAATARWTLSYIRTAVALSIATNIALPTKTRRPTKWRTRSAAIVLSRSARVISWYSRANSRSRALLCWRRRAPPPRGSRRAPRRSPR